jgi:tryptophan-rich sensory protein
MIFKLKQGLYAFILIAITAVLCRYFTQTGMEIFYESLNLPEITPPHHYFRFTWYGIYGLQWLSFYLILTAPLTTEQFKEANALFALQLFLMVLWTFSFFFMEQLIASAVVIVVLDMVVAMMLHTFLFINVWAFLLLLPYLFWLWFATYLNVFIVFLN